MRCKVLFRGGWKHIFSIPGFENVSPGEGSDWVKETHCCKKRNGNLFFFGFMIFYFTILELGHFDKHSLKTQEKKQGKILEFFLLDTLKTTFGMEQMNTIRAFFPKSEPFF